jgi:hypothetical protein
MREGPDPRRPTLRCAGVRRTRRAGPGAVTCAPRNVPTTAIDTLVPIFALSAATRSSTRTNAQFGWRPDRCQCVQSAAYRRPDGDAEEVAAVGGGHFREWLEARRQRAVPRPPRTSACRPRCSAAPAAAWTARTRPPDRPRRSPQQPHRSRAALHPRGVRTVPPARALSP